MNLSVKLVFLVTPNFISERMCTMSSKKDSKIEASTSDANNTHCTLQQKNYRTYQECSNFGLFQKLPAVQNYALLWIPG